MTKVQQNMIKIQKMLLSFDHKYKKTSQVIQNEFWLSIVIEFNDFLVQLNRFKLFLENNNFHVLSLVCFKIYLLNKKIYSQRKFRKYMSFKGISCLKIFHISNGSWRENDRWKMLCSTSFAFYETIFTHSLKIILYFTLFLKMENRKQ